MKRRLVSNEIKSTACILFLSINFICNHSCSPGMLSGKEINTKKELSEGLRSGQVVYFLCEYMLSRPGVTIIPMYLSTPAKVYEDSVYLYSFDTAEGTLTRLASLKPLSTHSGRGSVKGARWAVGGQVIYVMYNTGWDASAREFVKDVFRFDRSDNSAAESAGEGKKQLIERYFPGKYTPPVANKDVMRPSRVWYHVGGLPAESWRLTPPTAYAGIDETKCREVIIEGRGDRYFREAVFRKLAPSLSEKSAREIITSMGKWNAALPKHRQMTYAAYMEEWATRLAVEARYGNNAGAGELARLNPDVNGADGEGRTSLMIAAYADDLEVLDALIQKGAKVNARDGNGCTPLMYAIFGKAPRSMEFLLRRGADTKMESRSGWNAWMFVSDTGLRERYLECVNSKAP